MNLTQDISVAKEKLSVFFSSDASDHINVKTGGIAAIHEASDFYNSILLQVVLTAGANPNLLDNELLTPLDVCALSGNIEGMQLLLEQPEISLDQAKAQYNSLDIACSSPAPSAPKMVSMLIDAGANPNGREGSRQPVFWSIQEGRSDTLRLLLEAGAAPDALEPDGPGAPLHAAAGAGEEECVKALIEFGADPKIKDAEGVAPIEYARSYEHTHLLSLLSTT